MTPDHWNNLIKVVQIIEKYFEIERYTDTEGTVWFGAGDAPDEIWMTDSVSDGILTKHEMVRKMCRELWQP